MNGNVVTYRNAALRYQQVDGTAELGLSLASIAWAGLLLWSRQLVVGTWLNILWPIVLIAVMGTVYAGIHYGTKAIRTHLTYPRTGFVKLRMSRTASVVLMIMAAFVAAGLVLFIAAAPTLIQWATAGVGILIGLALCFNGYRFQLVRFYVLGAISAAAGIAVSMLNLDLIFSASIYMFALGITLAASGLLTLRSYLYTPPATGDEKQ